MISVFLTALTPCCLTGLFDAIVRSGVGVAQFLSICEEIVADRTMGITLTNMDTYNILKVIFGYRW